MKVLHLVAGNVTGGAAKGAYWLHRALLSHGVESRVLTPSRETLDDPTVISTSTTRRERIGSKARRWLDDLPLRLRRHNGPKFSTATVGYDFRRHPEFQSADIVHLHWINSGFVKIEHLAGIDKPLVWTLRDMWPMTGGCHYSIDCDRFLTGCGCCPQLASTRERDLSRRILERKARSIPRTLKVVCISDWMRACASESTLFRDFDVRTVRNSIDTDEFAPVAKETAREILDIPSDKISILAGAQYLESRFKGFELLLEALRGVERDRYRLLTFGRVPAGALRGLDMEHRGFGYLSDAVSMRLLYSAADMFAGPSIADALPKTHIEALSCGTPVVAFDMSGPAEIVSHRQDGYLARPLDTRDLARGIEWVASQADADALSRAARANAVARFDVNLCARRYREIYEELAAAGS